MKGDYVRHVFWAGGFRVERYEIMCDMLFGEKRTREGRKEVKGLCDLRICRKKRVKGNAGTMG